MKEFSILYLLIPVLLFCNACHDPKEDQYHITLINNSDEEIIWTWGTPGPRPKERIGALKPSIRQEYFSLIHNLIKPHTTEERGVDWLVEILVNYPSYMMTLEIYRFDGFEEMSWRDVIDMSYDEFDQKFPLKKTWVLSLEDLEARNWTFVYSPEE